MNRDSRGRFLKGHGLPGPGRPALAAELPFVEGVRAAGSAEQVARVIEKLATLALAGNVQAAALYLSYTVGKPTDYLHVTTDWRAEVQALGIVPEDLARETQAAVARLLEGRLNGNNE